MIEDKNTHNVKNSLMTDIKMALEVKQDARKEEIERRQKGRQMTIASKQTGMFPPFNIILYFS